MKKTILFSLLALALVSCSDDDEATFQLSEAAFVGDWVYDHPEEGIWETQRFTSSGAFYFTSDHYAGWKLNNRQTPGRYRKSGDNTLAINATLGGMAVENQLTVTALTPFAYSAYYSEAPDARQLFTYARLLSTTIVKPGESVTPDYTTAAAVRNGAFRSHNTAIATVDAETGTVTGRSSGFTYIDVPTPDGTAVAGIAVFDKDRIVPDCSAALGKTVAEIVQERGSGYIFRDDNSGVTYTTDDYAVDTIRYITGVADRQRVDYVQLSMADRVTAADISRDLAARYTLLPTNGDASVYRVATNAEGLTVVASYSAEQATVSFFTLKPVDLWADFTPLFGLSDAAVNKALTAQGAQYVGSDYSYSTGGSDYYALTPTSKADLAGFVFNAEGKMCEYWAYPTVETMADPSTVTTWLAALFAYAPAESTATMQVFYNNAHTLRVAFNITDGYVQYTSLTQKPFTPAAAKLPRKR